MYSIRFWMTAGLALFCGLACRAQSLDARDISASLKAGARAVVREDVCVIRVKNAGEATISRHQVITVLRPAGNSIGALALDYDKSRPVTSLSGALYDGEGRQLRSFKKKDFEDVSLGDGFSLFEDDRVKHLMPHGSSYPYTVSYDYTQKYKFTLFLPRWLPVEADGVAVERSRFTVMMPLDMPLRFYGNHVPPPRKDTSGGTVTYRWELTGQPALPREPLMPPLIRSRVPQVMLSPERFSYFGMKGSFTDWKGLGRWVSDALLAGRDRLTDEARERVNALTREATSPEDAARRIYRYVQQRTRYVSIQVGKGDLVPMKAADVDRVGYGDCKALVNYTMALLKAAGIPSYYTVVYGGYEKIDMLEHFASAAQGNHIILCVPFGPDTTWLECTSKSVPFGYLGPFTDDRDVLICTPGGGVFAHTPRYPDTLNRISRSARFVLDAKGALTGDMTTRFRGLCYEQRAGWEGQNPRERIQSVQSAYGFLQMHVNSLGLGFEKSRLPAARERLSFSSPLYAAPNGRGMSVPVNPVDRYDEVPAPESRRINPVRVMRGYETVDSLHFTLPGGMKLSLVPREVTLHSPYGDYETHLVVGSGELLYVRHFRIRRGTYPPSDYPALVSFLSKVSASDRQNFLVAR